MILRRSVKRAIGRAALTEPLLTWTRNALRSRVNVAYVHFVGEWRSFYGDFYRGSTLARFDNDLKELSRHFEFAPLADVVQGGVSSVARPRLAVTFDDGFDLLETGVADVLEKHGVRATTFVITSTVDNLDLMWRNKLSAIRVKVQARELFEKYNRLMFEAGLPQIDDPRVVMRSSTTWPAGAKDQLATELWSRCGLPPLHEYLREERPYFTWPGLATWVSRGHSVGLHTATHPYCSRLDDDAVVDEIEKPAAMLRQRLSLEFLPFSYPFGVRLGPAAETRLYRAGTFDCAFGINGFAPRGTAPHRLERAPIEADLAYPVYGRALLGRPRAA